MSGDLTIQNSDPSLILRDTDTSNPSNQAVRLRHNGLDHELPNGEGLGLIIDTPDTTGTDLTPAVITTGEFYAQNNQKVWHAGNDGAGSGLDADTLDGIQGSEYIKRYADLAAAIDLNTITTTGIYHQNSNAQASSGSNYPVGQAGLLEVYNNDEPGGNAIHTYQRYTEYSTGNVWTRQRYHSIWYAWAKQWDSTNDGSGSGLDADLLDGLQASQFLRSDASDTMSGKLTLNNGFEVNNVDWNDHLFRITGGSPHIEFDQTDGMRWQVGTNGSSFYFLDDSNDDGFYESGAYPLELTSSGLLKVNGSKVWNSGNDGSGSGLDADTLDGQHASAFASNTPGNVSAFAMSSAPSGWLKCNGAAISRTTYSALFASIGTTFGGGNGSTTFNLPDLRGEFIRGWDDGRGADSGRGFGSYQGDAIRNITGMVKTANERNDHLNNGAFYTNGTASSGTGGGSLGRRVSFNVSRVVPTAADNRPRNRALLYCIKY
jgi:hypothetical protein